LGLFPKKNFWRQSRCATTVLRRSGREFPFPAWEVLDVTNEISSDSCDERRKPVEVVVNKSQLVEKIASDTALGKPEVEKVVKAFIDTVQQSVKKGEKVSIPGFGGWNQTQKKARTGRNPRTGATVKIPASKGVKFTVGATFKELVAAKRGTATKATAAKAPAARKAAPAARKAAPAKAAPAARKAAPARKAAAPARKAAPAKKAAPAARKAAPAKKAAAPARKAAPAKATAAKKAAPARKAAPAKRATKR
jgi:DNA-binding protein HU-beta